MATKARRPQMRPELRSFLRLLHEHPSAGQVAQAYALPCAQTCGDEFHVAAISRCVLCVCVCVRQKSRLNLPLSALRSDVQRRSRALARERHPDKAVDLLRTLIPRLC